MRDSAEFDAFYTATSRRLLSQVFAMSGDFGEAEDALQEAYVRAWQRWDRISQYDNPEVWVRTVAFRLCVNAWWKSRNRLAAHWRAEARPQPGAELSPDLTALVQALRRLPERQRRVLVLHYVVDLTVDQISRETGMAAGTVKSHLKRGRAAVAPWVSEFSDDEPQQPAMRPNGAGRVDNEDSERKGYGYA